MGYIQVYEKIQSHWLTKGLLQSRDYIQQGRNPSSPDLHTHGSPVC